jgi:uncharacterized protein
MYTIRRHGLRFAWSERREHANRRKHGVSFAEAATVFDDAYARTSFDPEHSEDEDRFLLLGMSSRLRVLLVCHCYRDDESTIRIISARKADAQETQAYQRQRHDA